MVRYSFVLNSETKLKSNNHVCVSHPDSDREDASMKSKADVLVVPPKQMSSALGSLVANYGSMSESDSDEEPQGKFASIQSPNGKPSDAPDMPINLIRKDFIELSHPLFVEKFLVINVIW